MILQLHSNKVTKTLWKLNFSDCWSLYYYIQDCSVMLLFQQKVLFVAYSLYLCPHNLHCLYSQAEIRYSSKFKSGWKRPGLTPCFIKSQIQLCTGTSWVKIHWWLSVPKIIDFKPQLLELSEIRPTIMDPIFWTQCMQSTPKFKYFDFLHSRDA